MTAYKIDHIGIAVVSIDDALAVYRALGLEEKHREEVPSQGVVTAFLPAGESRIELLQPTSEDSPVATFVRKRGPGIHHICFGVRDIEGAVADLQARGFRLINSRPVPGADGKRVVFLHPDAGHGVLIELSEDARDGREATHP
jgi:methylmalonyl-CoA/ethylmalonyl-CoA epimerase